MAQPAALPISPARPDLRGSALLGLLLGMGPAGMLAQPPPPDLVPAIVYTVLAAETTGLPLPPDKRAPFGWPCLALGRTPVVLRPTAVAGHGKSTFLRVTVAHTGRKENRVAVALPGTGRLLGHLDLRFAHALETFELRIPEDAVATALATGVTLSLAGEGAPLWLVADQPAGSPAAARLPVEFQPHLMSASAGVNPVAELHRRIASLASLQSFGWMEGCVMEGLHALDQRFPDGPYRAALDAHWKMFVPVPGRLVYEDAGNEPSDDRIYGIEGGLPFADLGRRDPASALIDLFVTFAETRARARPDGSIRDYSLTAEGSYTIAYPLAVIAQTRNQPALAALALRQLQLRNARLWHDGAVWLRAYDDDRRTYRGWSRGVAWHALGVMRSIEPLQRHVDTTELETEIQRLAAWLLPLQRSDGLWSCYVEDAGTPPDTSGSAGIATMLAHGARRGILPPAAGEAARRTLAGCLTYLTPDGLLDGVAQSNSGGEDLQRGSYRVISQMGMGLLAQLIAECTEPAQTDRPGHPTMMTLPPAGNLPVPVATPQ